MCDKRRSSWWWCDGWQRARPPDMGSCVQCGGKALQCSHLTSGGGMADNTLAEVSKQGRTGRQSLNCFARFRGCLTSRRFPSELYFDTASHISCFVS